MTRYDSSRRSRDLWRLIGGGLASEMGGRARWRPSSRRGGVDIGEGRAAPVSSPRSLRPAGLCPGAPRRELVVDLLSPVWAGEVVPPPGAPLESWLELWMLLDRVLDEAGEREGMRAQAAA